MFTKRDALLFSEKFAKHLKAYVAEHQNVPDSLVMVKDMKDDDSKMVFLDIAKYVDYPAALQDVVNSVLESGAFEMVLELHEAYRLCTQFTKDGGVEEAKRKGEEMLRKYGRVQDCPGNEEVLMIMMRTKDAGWATAVKYVRNSENKIVDVIPDSNIISLQDKGFAMRGAGGFEGVVRKPSEKCEDCGKPLAPCPVCDSDQHVVRMVPGKGDMAKFAVPEYNNLKEGEPSFCVDCYSLLKLVKDGDKFKFGVPSPEEIEKWDSVLRARLTETQKMLKRGDSLMEEHGLGGMDLEELAEELFKK